ncbi:MAG: heavy-metal-associated domain-containing protein [Gammaproteobacteria bacterium]
MTLIVKSCALVAALLVTSAALAAAKTITLNINNMSCASCAPIVKKSLERVSGVTKVAVSEQLDTATVTYDDAKANIEALIAATTNAGYPSRLAGQ